MTDKMLADLAEVWRKMQIFQETSGPRISDINNALHDARHATYVFLAKHHATIMQNAIDSEKYRNDGQTHAEGCHTWGPKHYECLVEKYKQCFNDSKRLKALEQAMKELVGCKWVHGTAVSTIRNRADEIMRGGE